MLSEEGSASTLSTFQCMKILVPIPPLVTLLGVLELLTETQPNERPWEQLSPSFLDHKYDCSHSKKGWCCPRAAPLDAECELGVL